MSDSLAAAIRLTRAALKLLPELKPVGWLFIGMPMCVALALILGVGPDVQKSVFSILSSNAPDIYSANYQDTIAQFPSFIIWFRDAFQSIFILLAVTITLIALRASSLKASMLQVAVWSSALLTLVDFTRAVISRTWDTPDQITNVIANVAGGLAIALLIGVALTLFRMITLALYQKIFGLAAGAVLFLAFGTMVSWAVYFGLRGLYGPLPTNISFVLSSPVEGFYSVRPKLPAATKKVEDTSLSPFGFLPHDNVTAGALVTNVSGALSAQWQRNPETPQYDLEIRLVGDCPYTEIKDLKPGPPFLKKSDVSTISVFLDAGLSKLYVGPEDRRRVAFNHNLPTYYWLALARDRKSLEIAHFSRAEDQFQIMSSEKLLFLVHLPLLATTGEKLSAKSRQIDINIDGDLWRAKFTSSKMLLDDQKLDCHSMEVPAHGNTTPELNVTSQETEIGVLITITPMPVRMFVSRQSDTLLTIRGVDGWVEVTNLQAERLRDTGAGTIRSLSAKGAVSDLEVNNAPVEIKTHDNLFALGELRAQFIEDGKVKISGSAQSFWKNSQRLNVTRWEGLPTEWQLAILTAIASSFAAAARWVWPKIKIFSGEDVKGWA